MNTAFSQSPFRPAALSRGFRRQWLSAAIAAVFLVTACGGGGGGDGVASSPVTQSSLREGPITGFGSVIVNGVRFDDQAAQVVDDDGVTHGRDDLRLGMWVEVDSPALSGRTTGVANSVRFGSQLVGPVEAVDLVAGTMRILGQTVQVDSRTVFEGLGAGLASVLPGAVLEVHGVTQTSTGLVSATRVELESAVAAYKLRGSVTAVDTVNRTFSIGVVKVSYANVNASGLVVGAVVKARLALVQQGDAWVATAFAVQGRKNFGDRQEADIHGVVTSITTPSQFSLNGVSVDASKARFPDGSAGVVLGARLEVEGRLVDGVLLATKVEIDDGQADDDQHRPELHGAIGSLNTSSKTMVVRGLTVSYGVSTQFKGLTEAQLRNGLVVEVKGSVSPSGAVLASSISRED